MDNVSRKYHNRYTALPRWMQFSIPVQPQYKACLQMHASSNQVRGWILTITYPFLQQDMTFYTLDGISSVYIYRCWQWRYEWVCRLSRPLPCLNPVKSFANTKVKVKVIQNRRCKFFGSYFCADASLLRQPRLRQPYPAAFPVEISWMFGGNNSLLLSSSI